MSQPKDVTASIRARLSNYAREQNYTYHEVLQYYAIERFLFRLAQSKYRDTFVLKGGVAFFACDFPFAAPPETSIYTDEVKIRSNISRP